MTQARIGKQIRIEHQQVAGYLRDYKAFEGSRCLAAAWGRIDRPGFEVYDIRKGGISKHCANPRSAIHELVRLALQ